MQHPVLVEIYGYKQNCRESSIPDRQLSIGTVAGALASLQAQIARMLRATRSTTPHRSSCARRTASACVECPPWSGSADSNPELRSPAGMTALRSR